MGASRRDYFDVLGVGHDAGAAELKSAYRRLAMQYHPDRNREDPGGAEKFKEASEGYGGVSDPEKRQRYDRFGHAGFGASGGGGFSGFDPTIFADFSDLFGDLFGFSTGPERRMAGGGLLVPMGIPL